MLEQEHQHKLEVRETLLMTIAMLGLHTCSPSAQLLVLAVLVGRLDDLDPGIRSYAAELLLGLQLPHHSDNNLAGMLLAVCVSLT